jgi:hypothetical protein
VCIVGWIEDFLCGEKDAVLFFINGYICKCEAKFMVPE